jgi:hypothetical protein
LKSRWGSFFVNPGRALFALFCLKKSLFAKIGNNLQLPLHNFVEIFGNLVLILLEEYGKIWMLKKETFGRIMKNGA